MRQDWRPLALVTQLGLTVVVSLVLSLLLGLWLDNLLGTKPILTLLFSLIGVAAGTVGVYRLVAQAIAEAAGQGRPTTRRGSGATTPGPRAGSTRRRGDDAAWHGRDDDREVEPDEDREA